MKILFTTAIFPPDLGGPATYVDGLSRSFVQRGHQATILAFSDRPGEEEDLGGALRLRRIPRGSRRRWRMMRAIREEVRTHELVYANDLHEVTAAALRGCECPLAMKVVGDNIWQIARLRGLDDTLDQFQIRRYGLRTEIRRRLHRWGVRRADRVIVPSEYLGGIVRGWEVEPERIQVVPNAVPASFREEPISREEARLEFGIKEKTVLFVGRLTNWKGVDHLIRAVASLSAEIRLSIVGEGPMRAELEALVESLQVGDRVHFLGSIDHETLPRLYRAADVFVLPSSYEGLPHVVLEAMSQETPVVATAVGGTVELVRDGETGRLVPFADVERLASAIDQVLSDSVFAKRVASGGRDLVIDRTWENLVSRTESSLKELASTRDLQG
ncbi:MAG: glycosyltransferase family 4 protein [Planctomycetota bacterium]|jgi:glycosyltransferase involved in cell wall biosynthesis|nr:glycosyltransferase family 4 protein [Planctomycetota bacterium]